MASEPLPKRLIYRPLGKSVWCPSEFYWNTPSSSPCICAVCIIIIDDFSHRFNNFQQLWSTISQFVWLVTRQFIIYIDSHLVIFLSANFIFTDKNERIHLKRWRIPIFCYFFLKSKFWREEIFTEFSLSWSSPDFTSLVRDSNNVLDWWFGETHVMKAENIFFSYFS